MLLNITFDEKGKDQLRRASVELGIPQEVLVVIAAQFVMAMVDSKPELLSYEDFTSNMTRMYKNHLDTL